ncbi:hypothetical protein BJN34_20660 [Cupriavidus necator]|uniref:Lipoprotein n=1 Tax=Cupriavidus necator TaxID=106590 RepID=A0A1U9UUG4_CUPNE|nr:DUF799 domain-containing protein [Cupriavidus necator]AQV96290.1 hypothetical protein BJN34_20660 [Cupriavidus necator]
MMQRLLKTGLCLGAAVLFTGCATSSGHTDYSAYKASRPRSIVVLPPLNESPDVKATYGMLAQVSYPLAESGYYVLPVALVDETFRQNGLTAAGDMHAVAPGKLREIFGADAALYIKVTEYGAKYRLLSSDTVVAATGKLVDLRTGTTLWQGAASSANSSSGNAGGGIVGALIGAAIAQAVNSTVDTSYKVAGAASNKLLSAGQPNGLLYGPRSPRYESD